DHYIATIDERTWSPLANLLQVFQLPRSKNRPLSPPRSSLSVAQPLLRSLRCPSLRPIRSLCKQATHPPIQCKRTIPGLETYLMSIIRSQLYAAPPLLCL